MMVRPDEISASRAPSTRPLKHCDMKLAQLIIGISIPDEPKRCRTADDDHPRCGVSRRKSGVVAEVATEGVRLLHQRRARHDLEDLPVVLLVLHVLRRLALDDRSEERRVGK